MNWLKKQLLKTIEKQEEQIARKILPQISRKLERVQELLLETA